MLLRTKTLSKYSYSIKAEAIKKKLSRYNGLSFIRCFYQHTNQLRNPKIGALSNYPWCCFLALKWKFTTKENKDSIDITYNEFVEIINRVYDLQTEAANLGEENNFFLGMRRMMVNQFLYQYPDKFNYASLIRQYIWYCEGDEYYKNEFFRLTNLTLENYYILASYLVVISSINGNSDSEVFPFKNFIFHWVDLIGAEQVRNFIRLISIKSDELGLFFNEYKMKNTISVEYYQDTPMLRKPAIINNDGLIVLSKKILKAGLVSLVPELFKNSVPNYKDKFGVTLERYVGTVFDYYGFSYIAESKIKKIYEKYNLNGMSSDYIFSENNGLVFLDCKAIEPAAFVKTTSDPEMLRQRLKSSFIKGIFQCQNTAFNLSGVDCFEGVGNVSILIVLHRDHYISNGKDVQDLIYPTLSDEIIEKYGTLPVPLDRVYYITIDQFERLLGVCKSKGLAINDFISMCAQKDLSPVTRKANIDMHLHDIMPEGVSDLEKIRDVSDLLFNKMEDNVKNVSKVWDGRVIDYLEVLEYIQK